MKNSALITTFLPGFAPIIAYIAVEAAFGETAGLICGMALGLGEFLWILARERRIDPFTLIDTLLLAVMGGISWALSDPVFFRLKPAISEAALAVLMLLGSLGPHRYFLPYLQGKIGQGDIPEAVAKRMLVMVAGFALLTLAHAALTAAAALYWSKAAWNFVAGALFWILSALYVVAWTVPALIKARSGGARRRAEGSGEILPVVDGDGRVIGQAPRPLCHGGKKILHPVVRLWLGDGKGGYLMQKRSMGKLVQPGKWDCAVGGHISFGETAEEALMRESREEIGLETMPKLSPLMRFTWETALERELVFVYEATLTGENDPLIATLRADPAEVTEVRLWTADEIAREALKADGEREFTELARVELARMRKNP